MPLQATSGAATYDAFGGGAPAAPANYIEDVFNTYLTTGAGSSITVVNGIDLAGKGGLVWNKTRNNAASHTLFDTVRGVNNALYSNSTSLQVFGANYLPSFNNNGFVIGTLNDLTASGYTGVSWTFRKQPKFFDIVTYTGNDVAGRTISHSLGSVPGCIIVKRTDANADWAVYHRGLTDASYYLRLNLTSAEASNANIWNSTAPTSTVFTVGADVRTNVSGSTYVAYIFAHDAGGFGLSGTDNVISCGTFTTDGSGNATVSLGYEPQWVITKRTNSTGSWAMFDSMRGLTVTGSNDALLLANSAAAEDASADYIGVSSTGLVIAGGAYAPSATYIYIAIRRGPMAVPTDGTKVFAPVARVGTGADAIVTTGTNADLITTFQRTQDSAGSMFFFDKLRGNSQNIRSAYTNAETFSNPLFVLQNFGNTSYSIGSAGTFNGSGLTYINYSLTRAPGFFDEVCYTGTGVAGRTVTHNLTVTPELIIIKSRSNTPQWAVYQFNIGNTKSLALNYADPAATNPFAWNNTSPTNSVFTVGDNASTNATNYTYVAYLFASAPGVSKVGSYTGTGTTLQVNCGFTAGARFVLIKRTDSNGDWYVWDSARGIVAGNDPYLLLNSTAAEVTSTDYVDTFASGFEISSTAPAEINANGGTFVFLAIA